jgi:hypothetical protein
MCSTRISVESNSKSGLILLGNSGVGKSFIANVVLGQDVFGHECSASSVTHETEFQDYTVGDASYAVFNIPGLIEADQAAVDRNKVEIYKAFQLRPRCVVAFVFSGGSGGRIRDEDIIAFKAINSAYDFQIESLLLIVNDLPPNRSSKYEGETSIKLEHLLAISRVRVCFLDRINNKEPVSDAHSRPSSANTDSKSDQKKHGIRNLLVKVSASSKKKAHHTPPELSEREQMRMKLIDAIVQCIPHVYEKHGDIELTVDKVKQLTEESKQMQQRFGQQLSLLQADIAQRQQQFDEYKRQQELQPREIHHYHERVVDCGGGGICVIC